jgi:hypothetical protein
MNHRDHVMHEPANTIQICAASCDSPNRASTNLSDGTTTTYWPS